MLPKYSVPTLICKKCGKEYPTTGEYFRKNRHGNYGSPCKACIAIGKRKWRDEHPEAVKKHKSESAKRNRTHITEYQRQWKLDNPQSVQASNAKRDKEAAKARAKAWYADNKDQALKQQTDKYYANPEYREMKKAYGRAHNKVYKNPNRQVTVLRYRARKQSLPDNFTTTDWNYCLDYWNGRCAYCGAEDVPLAADHFIPITATGCPGTVPTNMIPACIPCNSSKRNRDPYAWARIRFPTTFGGILWHIELYFDSLEG